MSLPANDQNYLNMATFPLQCIRALLLIGQGFQKHIHNTVQPLCNDHLYDEIYYLWLIQ